MKLRNLSLGLLTTCAASVLAAAALADPPGRVGRISYIEGEVSFQPPQETFWTQATRNFPVAPGEAFWTGDQGRAELQVGAAQMWLDNQTELDVVDLDYGATRLSLAQGSMDIRVRRVPRGGITISTPVGEMRIDYAGLYRIDVGAPQEDGSYPQVEVTVFEGRAGVPGSDGLVAVEAGQGMLLDAGNAPQPVDIQYAAIDDWAHDREARQQWTWRQDEPAGLTGYEELGAYGDFSDTPDYGQVWFPRDVPADWAPYRYGHWAFVQPWGWTWIDDQSWGFAPFHYGRWAQVRGRWGWIPGRAVAEPVYAPALVAFVGGGGWSVGIGVGGGGGAAMGWVPLAPDEVYRPTYQVSNTYIRQVNVTNVNQTIVNNITVNNTTMNRVTINQYRNAPSATVVRADAFAHGAPVQRAVVAVSAQAMAAAPLTTVASRPVPAPEARAGFMGRAGIAPAPGRPATAAGIVAAPPPPPRLQAIRAAVTAQPAGAARPPVIAGATLAPPRPRPNGGPPTVLIAPAQVRNPAAQAIRSGPVPSARSAVPAPAASPPGALPVREAPARVFNRPQGAPPMAPPVSRAPAPIAAAPPLPAPQTAAGAFSRPAIRPTQSPPTAMEAGAQAAAQARARAQYQGVRRAEPPAQQTRPAGPAKPGPQTDEAGKKRKPQDNERPQR